MIGLLLNSILSLYNPTTSLVVGRSNHVKLIFLLVQVTPCEPETNTTDEGKDSDDSVVPDEERIFCQTDQCLTESSRESVLQKVDTHDETSHVLGSFAESVLETSNGGEDFGESDQAVWNCLNPDVDGGFAVGAAVDFAVGARRELVDVVLEHGGADHGGGGHEETPCDTLEWCEADVCLAESWVDEVVDDGDEDDQGQWVQVVDQIVWNAAELESGRLRSQVVHHLVVGEPVEWQPEEDLACIESTCDLVDPDIVDTLQESWCAVSELAGLDLLPEIVLLEVPVGLGWVGRPAALAGEAQSLECLGKHRLRRWAQNVVLLAEDQNNWGEEEHEGWQCVGKPESNIFLSVDHSNTTNEGSGVDHHVEIQENAGVSDLWVNNNAFSSLFDGLDDWSGLWDLLSQERRDVGLETSCSDSHDHQTDCKTAESSTWVVHDSWDRGDDENGVSDDCSEDRPLNGHVASEIGIGDVTSNERHEVGPELVEGRQTSRSTLILSKSTSLLAGIFTPAWRIVAERALDDSSCPRAEWAWLLDEVDEDCRSTVVRETPNFGLANAMNGTSLHKDLLAEFHECHCPRRPWNAATDSAQRLHLGHRGLLAIWSDAVVIGSRVRIVLLHAVQSFLLSRRDDTRLASLCHHMHVLIQRCTHDC